MFENLKAQFNSLLQTIRLGAFLVAVILLGFFLSVEFIQPNPKPKAKIEQEADSKDKNSTQDGTLKRDETPQISAKQTELVDKPRIVAPELVPDWAEGNAPLQRVAEDKPKADPRRKSASRYEGTVILGAGLYKIHYGRRYMKIALNNVDPLPFRHRCFLNNGELWPCGGWVRRQVSRLLQFQPLYCNIELTGEVSNKVTYPAQCWFHETDLADILIQEGWGTPLDDSNEYRNKLLAEAQRLGKGMWRKF